MIYLCRNADLGLLGTLLAGLSPDLAHPPSDLSDAWRQGEEDAGRPLAVILDQAEEAFTPATRRPAGWRRPASLRRSWIPIRRARSPGWWGPCDRFSSTLRGPRGAG